MEMRESFGNIIGTCILYWVNSSLNRLAKFRSSSLISKYIIGKPINTEKRKPKYEEKNKGIDIVCKAVATYRGCRQALKMPDLGNL
jgi:hypothetical protein